jgi:hypothetical protein
MPLDEAWKSYTQQRYAQKQGQGIVNAGSGNLYDSANTGQVAIGSRRGLGIQSWSCKSGVAT